MPPIKNWSRVVNKNVSDVKRTLAGEGTVRMWRHVDGDTVGIKLWRNEPKWDNGIEYKPSWYYAIFYNDEQVEATQTLNTAIDDLVLFMRSFPDGIPD
jgi:hypothetical protein